MMIQAMTDVPPRDGDRFSWTSRAEGRNVHQLHPSWRRFIAYCTRLEHGEIERLKIQDGLPVLAEVTREKVKFT